MTEARSFRDRLVARELLVGTWVKTPSPIVCEVLATTSLDALCLDAEHAPFGRLELDACIAATRAAGSVPLVRVPANAPHHILNALDCGASGVVIPHVTSAEGAQALCRASLYGPGGRGYSGSTRAAGFGAKTAAEQIRDSDAETAIIAQIEDVEGLDAVEEIAAVERLDCLFIGRMDLTVSLEQTDPAHPAVTEAVETICAAAQSAGKAVGMWLPSPEEVDHWREKGASLFLLASDQAFLKYGARDLVSSSRA